MTARLFAVALVASLVAAPPAVSQEPAAGSDTPQAPKIALQSSEASGFTVHYLTIPWGPSTFATMEAPSDSFYNRRSWPFARLETEAPFRIASTTIEGGNFALVFHPNNAKDEGMGFEVLRIPEGEFLQPGNAMTRTPEGESLFRQPIRFSTADAVARTLTVGLTPTDDGALLTVRYGDRQLVRELGR